MIQDSTKATIPRRVGLAAAVAVVADLAVFAAARSIWGVPRGFVMLNPVSIIVAALVGAILAGVGLAMLKRITPRADAVFLIALTIITLLSLAGPLEAMQGAIPGLPRATAATGATMIVLHFLTAGVLASMLVRADSLHTAFPGIRNHVRDRARNDV